MITILTHFLALNREIGKKTEPVENEEKKPTVRQRMLKAAGMEESPTNELNLPGYINVVKNQR